MKGIVVSQKEIDDVIDHCVDRRNIGGSEYPGMTYEEGIIAAIEWLFGDSDDHPLLQ